jgi:transglutaminase-like putative cysteine protease
VASAVAAPEGASASAEQAVPRAAEPRSARPEPAAGAEETWTTYHLSGAKVGYSCLRSEPVQDGERPCLRYHYEDVLVLRRFDGVTVVSTRIRSLETVAGEPLAFTSEVKTGPGAVITEGRRAGGRLLLETSNLGKTESAAIPWEAGWGGFFADRQSLRHRPLRPRDTRIIKALLPVVNLVGETRLTAGAIEATSLRDGSRQLLHIDVTTQAGATPLKFVLWADDRGEVWKMRDLQLGLEAYLATKEAALQPNEAGGFDLGRDAVVRVSRPLHQPHQTRRIVYRARLRDGNVAGLFATGLSQSVQPRDEQTAEVTVRRIRPDEPATVPEAGTDKPTDGDLAASVLVQSDDAQVVAMATAVAKDEQDPWHLACALERHVKASITLKSYSAALATAAEVVRSREGDCTEHAMLLAALCRARKIPARIAIGLLYYPPQGGFAYHMWTEAWIKDRWIPLDATLGLGGIGAAHVKLATSRLQGVTAYADLLPVVPALRRLQLELVTVE